jgi:hypothetical protein
MMNDNKLRILNFVKILEIKNHISKQLLLSKHTRIQIYKPLTRPALTYDSESWAVMIPEEG